MDRKGQRATIGARIAAALRAEESASVAQTFGIEELPALQSQGFVFSEVQGTVGAPRFVITCFVAPTWDDVRRDTDGAKG